MTAGHSTQRRFPWQPLLLGWPSICTGTLLLGFGSRVLRPMALWELAGGGAIWLLIGVIYVIWRARGEMRS